MKTKLIKFSLTLLCASMFVSAYSANRQTIVNYASTLKGLKKADLKAAIYNIIQPKKVLNYGSGSGATWSGFYKTDRVTSTNEVRNRYSTKKFYFPSNYSYSAISGMNIEHSFPKSWWGGTSNNAYRDLFNLYPSESEANSVKSNYPMGEVTNAKLLDDYEKVGTGSAGSHGNVILCEPNDAWKGDFARSYMYMATCYQNFTWEGTQALIQLENDKWPTLQDWAYKLYLKWEKNDPVDEIEIARNNAVNSIQGNRNLFIDYPYLAEYVWGDSVDVAFNPNTSITTADDDDRYAGSKVGTKVSAPLFTPGSGTFVTGETVIVTLSTSTEGAKIYYTTDGSIPTTSSTLYDGPINVSANTTIKALAVKDGMNDSNVAVATYTFNETGETVEAMGEEIIYQADFTTDKGDCTIENAVTPAAGVDIWQLATNYGWKGTAYSSKNFAGDGTLYLPEMDLSEYTDISFTFDHAVNYSTTTNPSAGLTVLVISDGTATSLNSNVIWPNGKSWTPCNSGVISLKQFEGKKIQIAFHYTSTASLCPTWEIQSATVKGTPLISASAMKQTSVNGVTGYYGTAYVGFDAIVPSGVKLYKAIGVKDGNVTIEQMKGSYIPGGTGFIIASDASVDAVKFYKKKTATIVVNTEDNLMNGSTQKYAFSVNGHKYYVMTDNGIDGDFAYQNSSLWIGSSLEGKADGEGVLNNAHQAFIDAVGVADSKLTMTISGANGIHDVNADTNHGDGYTYDIMGRRVKSMNQPGVYICNGVKYVVKGKK